MDIETIKSLIQVISKSNISEIKIQLENTKIYIKNNYKYINKNDSEKLNEIFKNSDDNKFYSTNYNNKIEKYTDEEKNIKNKFVTIKSPIIGTFYRKPNPDKENFVKIGDIIKVGMKVCVIESMKLFNDIESDVNGKLIKILVDDATPVDYDQPLFLLESYNTK